MIADEDLVRSKRLAKAIRARRLMDEREAQSDLGERGRPGGLIHFVRYFWHVLEPNEEFQDGWPLEAICMHLEAVTRGEVKRLLMNVCPGFMKSLMTDCFWPAWEWSAAGMPGHRYVTFAYASSLTERDNLRMLMLIRSREFQEMWGKSFALAKVGAEKVGNDKTGWKIASSVKGVGTGERGTRVIVDDPHNVKDGESEAIRSETVRWFRESLSDRFNNMEEGVLIVIMQRVHEDDVAGAIIANSMNYCHLMIPMEYDPERHCSTEIGWEDPRTEYGELAWETRFSKRVVAQLKVDKGPYAYAGQYQQSPEPRGGGIIKRDWWGAYELKVGEPFRHKFDYIVGSLDGAYTSKEENDPSGFSIWGAYQDGGRQKVVLLHAWKKWLEIHGQTTPRLQNEDNKTYVRRASPNWGLVEWVAHDCTRLRVNTLLIEDKASGHSVAQEIARLYKQREWRVQLVNPRNLDKRARTLAIQHLFADGMIEAPASLHGDVLMYRDWAQMVIDEFTKFRGLPGDQDNLVDSGVQALKYLRDNGIAIRREERQFIEEEEARFRPASKPLYNV